ncbi:unnamed protein product [Moneuplotes crassus]|uniref:Uncharacterized protein n=1 Tax=Euplotes crassus TaxID=5936 RepID=A0AAD1XCB0_EUPCR|nr:unnamed protein product [Moneuplotes crassus]
MNNLSGAALDNKGKGLLDKEVHNGEISAKSEDDISYMEATKNYIWLAIPSIAGMLLRRSLDIVNYAVIGQMGDATYASGLGLGMMTINMVAICLGNGLSGGIETLCSQAFGRNDNYQAGQYYKRAQVILTALFIPQAILLYFATPLLMASGQPERSSQIAGEYILICLPGIWCYCQTELLRRFLGAQKVFNVMMNSQIINVFLHFVWVFIFVYILDFSYKGVYYASLLTYILNLALPILYINYSPSCIRENCWHSFSSESFKNLGEYLKYGIPSMIMLLFECWAFELLIFMVGIIGEKELGVFVICFNIVMYVFMIPMGCSFAANACIGNSLGASKPKTARIYSNVCVASAVVLSCILGGCQFLLKDIMADIFIEDEMHDLFTYTITMMVILSFCQYLQNICQGMIKAMGYQKYGTIICLIGYWGVCIPLTYLFTFVWKLEMTGVLLGAPIGLFAIASGYIFCIYATDFNKLSNEIVQRLQKGTEGKT